MALFDKLERVADQASTLIHETVVLVHLAQETLRMLRPVLEDLPQITAQTRRVLEDLESRGISPP